MLGTARRAFARVGACFARLHNDCKSTPAHCRHRKDPFDAVAMTLPHIQPFLQIHSPEELAEVLAANSEKLVCLMCKAIGCRPCKVPPPPSLSICCYETSHATAYLKKT